MNSFYRNMTIGEQYQAKKVILETEDTSIYICSKESNLYTVNQYKTNDAKAKAAEICNNLNPDIHKGFHEMFTHESALYVVFYYHNGIELRKYLVNNNPDIFERLEIGEKVIENSIEISSYPSMIKMTAMQINNVVVLNNDMVSVNFYLDYSNTPLLLTDSKYIATTGNILYELFSDIKNCPNQIDSFVVKAAFGRYDTLERMALEYSAVKSEVIDFFMDVDRPVIQQDHKHIPKQEKQPVADIKDVETQPSQEEEKETKKPEPLLINWLRGKEKPAKAEEFIDGKSQEQIAVKEQVEKVEPEISALSTADQISLQLLKAGKELSKASEEKKEKEMVKEEEETLPVTTEPVDTPLVTIKSAGRSKKKEVQKEKHPLRKKHVKAADHEEKKQPESTIQPNNHKLIYPSANGRPVTIEKPRSSRKSLRFPVKTVTLFFAIFVVMIGVTYGLSSIFQFFDDRDTKQVNNDISDSVNPHEISVEGNNGSKIETTQPGETTQTPVETTRPVETTQPEETTQPAETSRPQPTSDVIEYVVKPGDFMRKISKDFYGTEEYYNVIVEYNNLTGTELTVGQKLYIPPLVDDSGKKYELYVVQPGDYLILISRKVYNDGNLYKLILDYNNLDEDDEIVVGQILKIPVDPA